MKKLFALLAVVLAVVSCQKDADGLDVNVGGDIAKISVALPDDAITRAGGTDSAKGGLTNTSNEVVRVILQVYYNGEASSERLVEYLGDGETVANFDVRLVPDRAYTFVAWADQVKAEADEDLYYNTKNLKAVTMMPRTWSAMDERRDAYTHTMTKTFTASANLNMTLTRPFAKLRIKTTDMQHLRKVGIEPTTATISYTTKHYTTFNAFAGEAVDKENAGVAHEYTIATYSNETGNEKTLYADYFFASTEEEVVNFTFAVRDQKGEQIKQNTFNTSIPVKRNHLTTIAGNILTENNNFDVTLDERFDGAYVKVEEAAYAQSELDNAIANTTIYLEPGVNYGVLYLRPAGAPTKEVDWIGNNYRYETYSLFENLTIVGAEGATVDAIKIEGGTYYNTAHSQSDKYPVMLSLIELKNVVIDGVTFTGKGGYDPQGYGNAINLSGSNIKVDGLTLKNCVLNNDENDARLLYKTESTTRVHTYTYNGETYTFTPSLKNITITGCTLNGGYMGLELREAENITITNNEFNVNDRNILLPVNTGCTYSGNITITGNVSNNAKERFVRADGTGDAVVVISNNTLKNYQGADPDYIKVTNGNNVTIENNILINYISTAEEFISALNANGYYEVINDITISGPQAGTLATRANDNKDSVIDLNGYTITFENVTAPVATIEADNTVTFVGEGSLVVANSTSHAILNKGTVVDETFNVTDEIISSTGDGVVEYVVSDVECLMNFADAVDGGNTFEGKTVKLTEDVDFTGKTWDPIGDNREDNAAFKGTFDGQNHTIKGLSKSSFDDSNYGSKEGWGLFSVLDGATVKNVKLDDEVFASYTVISGAVAGYANNTTFENIDITNTKIAGYNWYTGGVVGWAAGNCTFKDINLDSSVVVGTLWDSHGQNAGGIAGGVRGDGTYIIEDCNIACVMDVINDVTSNYKWWIYRVSGMIIGNTNTTETKYNEVVTATATNVTCKNVTVTYGDWMNYHYCEGYWNRGWGRYESSDYVGGVDQNEPHNHADGESHYVCVPFDQLFGGSSNGSGHYPVRGLREFDGVTVNYPASYRREVATVATLTDALNKGLSVVLENDIDFGSTQLAITGENQVVDLGGHALTTANNWGGISLKNGATIKNGTITHSGNTAAIKAFNGSSVENVTINATCSTADKTVTGIAVQQGANVESIKNVTINGVSQGIEVGYQATVGLIENAVVNESNNGTANGIGLVINGGKVGLAKNCKFIGDTYGITLHLKGVFAAGLNLENCEVKGNTHDLYTWDEKGISNTSGSLVLTYDDATEQKSGSGFIVADFEEECASVVSIAKR